jgi:hypothetical protein
MSNEANLLVFRETKTQVSTQELVQELSEKVAAGLGSRQAVMDALIRAGELECAFSDANASGTKIVTALTDHLAALLVSPNSEAFSRIQEAKDRIRDLLLPETVVTSPPEGFAYYALHPTDFADSAIRFVRASKIAVIGIRSIGTTLSAVVSAALNAQGYFATRTTVRPTGHPYNRQTRFSDEQLQSIRADDMRSGHFVVVDEGPGLSGSSFLSVGEALIAQGIGPDRITLIGTRDPDPDKLYASNGRDRWSRFRHVTISPQFYGGMPQGTSLSGGAWRELFLGSERAWPPLLATDGAPEISFVGREISVEVRWPRPLWRASQGEGKLHLQRWPGTSGGGCRRRRERLPLYLRQATHSLRSFCFPDRTDCTVLCRPRHRVQGLRFLAGGDCGDGATQSGAGA